MSNTAEPPFQRTDVLDKPGIVGAEMVARGPGYARSDRQAAGPRRLRGARRGARRRGHARRRHRAHRGDSEPETTTSLFNALEMQRKYGWSFGATGEPLTFDGQSQQPFDKSALDRMVVDFAPAQSRLRRFSSPTLFQSPNALPTSVIASEAGEAASLRDALQPIITPEMDVAYRAGKSLASLFNGLRPETAVVVDLPGPLAIAFAAGLAETFDPCFTFENWPHPRGVVRAHLTLGASAYYQPLFGKMLNARKQPGPMALVLDRDRLAAYTDDASQFDNRYAAKLPTAAALKELGVKNVLYVVPDKDTVVELDDLNEQLVAYVGAGLSVKAVAAKDFGPPGGTREAGAPYYYGSSPWAHESFWDYYPWNSARQIDASGADRRVDWLQLRSQTPHHPVHQRGRAHDFGLVPCSSPWGRARSSAPSSGAAARGTAPRRGAETPRCLTRSSPWRYAFACLRKAPSRPSCGCWC